MKDLLDRYLEELPSLEESEEAARSPEGRRLFRGLDSPDMLGVLDKDGVLNWLPSHHPETGEKLSRQQRRQWFLNLLEANLGREHHLTPSRGSKESNRLLPASGSPVKEPNKKRQLAILISLLLMKQEWEENYLPTPESL